MTGTSASMSGGLSSGASPAGGWVAIAANPYSGSRENRRLVGELVEALRARGMEGRVVWERAALSQAVRAAGAEDAAAPTSGLAAPGCRCVVAAGGDGTLSVVVNERPEVPVAVLPLGTENLFASEFAFTRDVAALAGAIAAGRTRPVDLGRAGDAVFATVASAGFDAHVAHGMAAWRDGPTGLRRVRRLTYARHILRAALAYHYPVIDVEADGRRLRGALAMVFNLPRYAFGFGLCPRATGDDGLLDYVVFERPGRVRLGVYAASMLLGRHLRRGDVHHGRARRVRLTAAEPVPFELDGERAGFTPCDIEVLPGALRVIVM